MVWEGEHLEFASDEDIGELCGGTLPHNDKSARYVLEALDPSPSSDKLRLHWIPDDASYQRWCTDGSIGCITDDGAAVSRWPIHQHELVHLVRGSSYPPLAEGVAEYFGDDRTRFLHGDAEEMLSVPAGSDVEFHVGVRTAGDC